MKLNNSAQNLLERYLLGVRRALSGKSRDDITEEIRSFLLDNLESRFNNSEEISESEVKDVLTELGSPHKLASQFSQQRHLIGPRWYPAYIMVLRIIVPVVMGALTISFIIRLFVETNAFTALEYLGAIWNGAFMSAAFVTLVFAIMERVNEGKDLSELEELEKFNISDLPDLAESEKQPGTVGLIFEIVMGVLGLAFFTYLYHTGGYLPLFANETTSVGQLRIFTDNFMSFVPFMMAITGLDVSRSATLLVQGRTSSLTSWWHVATQIAGLVLTAILLNSFPLLTLDGIESLGTTLEWDMARVINSMNTGLRVILILSLIGSVVEIIKQLVIQARMATK